MSDVKKQTFKWVAFEDGSTITPTLTSTDQARGIIFTDAATSYHNDTTNYIQIQWALDGDKTLKCTVQYGNNNAVVSEWFPGIATLESAENYYKNDYNYVCTELTEESDHLF